MLFDDEEIGGKTLTPATKRYFGDPELASRYLWYGQLLLGGLKQRMQQAGLPDGHVDAELPGPVFLKAKSNQWGLADIDEIWIDVRALAGASASKSCIGFVAHVLGENKQLFVRGPNDTTKEYLYTSTSDIDPRIEGQGLFVPGAIPNTTDRSIAAISNYAWEIYFGTYTITVTHTIVEGPRPAGVYHPTFAAQIEAGYFVPTTSWEYSTTTRTYDLISYPGPTYEITVDQIQPNIYTGGYRVVEPSGDVVKTDPVDGWTFFDTYGSEVCGMSVDDAQYFIGGANLRTTADAWLAQYPTILNAYYEYYEADFLESQQQEDGQPIVQQFAPTETIRNRYNHIASSAEPTEISRGAITAGPSSTDAFISVLPGPTTYTFADENDQWYNAAYQFTSSSTPLEFIIELQGGAYFLELGFNPLQTAVEDTMLGLGQNIVIVQSEFPAHVDLNFTRERLPEWHAFTAEALVAPGDYLVTANGLVRLTLLIESIHTDGQKTYSFEFAETQLATTAVDGVAVTVGTPFTSVEEIVSERNVTGLFT